jgi:hypothetical protein
MKVNIKRTVFLIAVAIGVIILLSSVISYKSAASAKGIRSAGEDIRGTYYMNLTENMTAVVMDFSFEIYKINGTGVNDRIVYASEIRNYSGLGQKETAVSTIENKINGTITSVIGSAFPEDKNNISVTKPPSVLNSSLNETNPVDYPIIVEYKAMLWFTPPSFKFTKPVNNMSDVIRGTLTMGAIVNKSIELKADPGYTNAFVFSLPLPYNVSYNSSEALKNGTVSDVPGSNSSVGWTIDNKDETGTAVKKETKYLRFQSRDPKPTTKEEILIYTNMNIVKFGYDEIAEEGIKINIGIDIKSINISKYTDMVPSTIENLRFISSDGIRLMENNGLTTTTEMQDKSVNQSKKKVEDDLNNIFKNPQRKITLTYAWYRTTLNGYDLSNMSATRPVTSYLNSTAPTGFSVDSLKITIKDTSKTPNVHEIIMSILRMGAVVNKDFNLTAEPNRKVTLNITGPQSPNGIWFVYLGGNITDSGAVVSGTNIGSSTKIKNAISFSIDNLNGVSNKQEKVNLTLEPSSKNTDIIGRTSQDIQIWSTIDLKNMDDIDMNVTVRVAIINVNDYKDIKIPESVSNLTYITAECIRMVVKNGLASWDDITKGSENSSKDLEKNLLKIFNLPLNLKTEIVEGSKLIDGGIDLDNMPAYFTKPQIGNPKVAEVLITLTPTIPEGEKLQFNKSYLGMKEETKSVNNLTIGVLKMGADITTNFDVETDKGTKMFVEIVAPQDVTPSGTINATVGNTSTTGTMYTVETNYRAVRYPLDNIVGTEKKKATVSLNLASSSPLNITKESIEIESKLDLNDFYMSINLDVVIKSIEIEKYKIDVPEKVHNLKFITADGVRLAVENGLASWEDILNNVTGKTKDVNEKLTNATGSDLTITYNWNEMSKNEGYDILDMGVTRPALRLSGSGSTPMSVKSGNTTISRDALIGFLNAGATATFSSGKVDANYTMTITVVLPRDITFAEPQNLTRGTDIENREAYRWSDPANKSISGMLKSTRPSAEKARSPEYAKDKTLATIVVDIPTITIGKGLIPNPKEISADVKLDITAEIYRVSIETYGIELPEDVKFKYINADAIRLALSENVASLDNISSNIYVKTDSLNDSLRKSFNDPTIGLSFEYDWSTLREKDSSGKEKYIYDLNNMKEDVPIRIRLKTTFTYKMGGTSETASLAFIKSKLESAITLMKVSVPLSLQGIKGWDSRYRVIFPEGIVIADVSAPNAVIGNIGGRQYFEYLVEGVGMSEDPKVDLSVSIGITPMFLLTIPLIRIIVISLVAIIVIVIVYKVARRKKAKERKQKKKEEKMRKRAERIKRMELKRELKEFKPTITSPKKEAEKKPPEEPDIEPAEPIQEGDEFLKT